MAYYLSKENRRIVDLISSRLKEQNNDGQPTKIRTSNSNKLENIVRSAIQFEEYSWIGDRFIIRNKPGELWFVERELLFEFAESKTISIDGDQDFWGILNILLLQNPTRVEFSSAILEPDEVTRLQEWGKEKNFDIKYENGILKVKKNG